MYDAWPMNFVRRRAVLLAAAGLVASSCGATGPFVWIDALPASSAGPADVVTVQEGDTLNVRVFNQEPLSTRDRVRPDGKITMPVVGEVMARGKRPAQLASEIQDRLKSVVVAPSVTVTIDTGAEMKVSVIGEVRNAGIYPLDHGANVLHALAAAGGLSDYADSEKIFVVRKSFAKRVRFRFQDLRAGSAKSLGFMLQAGDVVVVE